MEKHVPTKQATTRHNQPWITTDLKRLTHRKQRSYNMQKGKPRGSREHRRYVQLKRQTEAECQKAQNNYMKDTICATDTSSSKRFWSYIKSKRRDHSGISPLKDNNGIIHNDSNAKAKILNDQFSSTPTKTTTQYPIKDQAPIHPYRISTSTSLETTSFLGI